MAINKNIITIIIGVIGFVTLCILGGCNDSFMDKIPETSITEEKFFNTPSDLEIYTNGMYGYIGSNYWDVASDNVIYNEDNYIYKKMRNEVNPDNSGTWSWGSIRNVNFMLARADRVQGDAVDIDHYVGLARMFRAKLYYDKVFDYSDVPWYSRDLLETDTDLLFKPQDPRAQVVDSVMADLEYAVTHMKDGTSRTRWFRNGALAIQARIALREGTFRKYHPELELNDGDRFLKIAVEACRKIMDSGEYELATAPAGNIDAYEALFCSQDLGGNKEMIIYEAYSQELGRRHGAGARFDWTTGLSRDLMEDYLVIEDGKTKTFQEVPGYDTKSFLEVFENRDPRLRQTFMPPGFIRADNTKPHRQKISLGGYPQVKFSPRTSDQIPWDMAYTDLPLIRYAEVLLMYAEAKAELGELTQDDLDQTINLLRDRVGMPRASLGEWLAKIDPVQAGRYPNVGSSQKGAILEIRRERRIELACEGFRFNDLMRWGAGKLMESVPEGIYINELGLFDITGDGDPDYALVATRADADAIPQDIKEKYQLTVEILEGNTFQLTEGNKGYIRMIASVGKWNFIEPKYYYDPISTKDIVLNKNLVQNKYWAK